jgi:hypothetical protein
MHRRTPLKRRTPLRQVNRARRAKIHARNFGDAAVVVRSMPCLVVGCREPAEAAHARARGMGGVKGSSRDLVPLCRAHHIEAGEARTSKRHAFEVRHGISLTARAAELAEQRDKDGES